MHRLNLRLANEFAPTGFGGTSVMGVSQAYTIRRTVLSLRTTWCQIAATTCRPIT
jgi:hypothetical protein